MLFVYESCSQTFVAAQNIQALLHAASEREKTDFLENAPLYLFDKVRRSLAFSSAAQFEAKGKAMVR